MGDLWKGAGGNMQAGLRKLSSETGTRFDSMEQEQGLSLVGGERLLVLCMI